MTVSLCLYVVVVSFENLYVTAGLVLVRTTCIPFTAIFALLASTYEPPSVAFMLIVGVRLVVPFAGILLDRIGGVSSIIVILTVSCPLLPALSLYWIV